MIQLCHCVRLREKPLPVTNIFLQVHVLVTSFESKAVQIWIGRGGGGGETQVAAATLKHLVAAFPGGATSRSESELKKTVRKFGYYSDIFAFCFLVFGPISSADPSCFLASKLCKRLQKPIFVSCDLDLTSASASGLEKRLWEEIDKSPDAF